jgi:hypothetical protein
MLNARWSLILGIIAMIAWIAGGVVAPLGSGWIHLLLAVGMMLLIRAIVLAGAAPRGRPSSSPK